MIFCIEKMKPTLDFFSLNFFQFFFLLKLSIFSARYSIFFFFHRSSLMILINFIIIAV